MVSGAVALGPLPQAEAFAATPADLGSLGAGDSSAFGVNDAGQVVGGSVADGDAAEHAFVWDAVAGMVDLGTLGG